MGIYNTALTSIRAVQSRGTNIKDVETFLDWNHEYKGRLKINWGNGEVKVKSSFGGWQTIPKGRNAWIVQGYKKDLIVMENTTFKALFQSFVNDQE